MVLPDDLLICLPVGVGPGGRGEMSACVDHRCNSNNRRGALTRENRRRRGNNQNDHNRNKGSSNSDLSVMSGADNDNWKADLAR